MYLLDVNVLIALCDADHVHHRRTKDWFRDAQYEGWATCPLTENALLRIIGHPEYPDGPGTPSGVLPILQQLRSHPHHIFLKDSLSLADSELVHDLSGVSPISITDLYLLALAVSHRSKLATLDKGIDGSWVFGGANALVQI